MPGNTPIDKKRFTLGDLSSGLGSLAKKATAQAASAISTAANYASGNKEGGASPSAKDDKKDGVFEISLEEVMALQKDQPELEVPKILVALTDAVVSMGGCKTEGIFRVPANAIEVQALKKHVNSFQYDVEAHSKDVNVPAALLKLWFRSLPDSLVPTALYDTALAAPGPEGALTLINKLPSLNAKVIRHLVKFLALMAEPDHVKATLMTLENLAMVFAPSLLRCPSEDPMMILANAKRECAFVKNLIIGLEPSVLSSLPPSTPVAISAPTYSDGLDSPVPASSARSSKYQEDEGGHQENLEKEFDDLAETIGSSDS